MYIFQTHTSTCSLTPLTLSPSMTPMTASQAPTSLTNRLFGIIEYQTSALIIANAKNVIFSPNLVFGIAGPFNTDKREWMASELLDSQTNLERGSELAIRANRSRRMLRRQSSSLQVRYSSEMRFVKMDNHWILTFPIILKMTHYLRDFATSLESPLLTAGLPTALLQASYLSLPLLSSALLAALYPYLSQHRLARSLNSYLFTFNSALHLLAAASMAYLAPSYMTDYVVGEDTSFDSDLEIVSSILYVPILSLLLPGSSVLTYGMQVSKYMRWALMGGSGLLYYFLGKSVNVVAYNVFFRSDKYLVDTAQSEGGLQGEKYGLSDYIVSVSVLTVIWAAAASFLAYFVPYMSGTTVGMGDAVGTLIYSTISYMAMVQPANLALIDYLGTSV